MSSRFRRREPSVATRLDAALRTMETLAPARYGSWLSRPFPAVQAERLAAELDRPDLVIRAGLARADMLHRRRHSECNLAIQPR
ncbi:hypothetical protein QLQ12_44750 [Actinoplanes sp. NEAU-A12]|uniref:Uncharacterized protein n=1 Tax=Actinoplanes sandaracinus TaxID=3045177 RepID=A0ABT6X139_9ACTN|nr:hypothetical protein [Actinoplanes sandaracinus]MDI6105713.1 hypothetical protein [Actinoplanes sandaracinus]